MRTSIAKLTSPFSVVLLGLVAALLAWTPAAGGERERVLLGEDDLTAGIPGEATLTVDQINRWLAEPRNHAELDVELPFGLSAATANIQGLKENPLTRAKIELGRQLYFDRRLSADGTVSCADCHHPAEGFTRHTQFGIGIDGQEGNRNSPVSYNRIVSGPQFWDGRAASLEEQAIGPIANPIEMGNTHQAAVKTLKEIEGYRLQFAKIFDDGITIENVGKAIAAFERVIVTGPAPADYYERLHALQKAFAIESEDLDLLKEDDPDLYDLYESLIAKTKTMSESAKRGRDVFHGTRGKCTTCHAGANFADEQYHNLGVGMSAKQPDLGRYLVTKEEKDKGAFKTPTLRNVALTAPYMHDGSQTTLEEVVEWYDKGGHPNPYLSDKMVKLNLTNQEKKDLVAYMKSLSGKFPRIETGRLPQ